MNDKEKQIEDILHKLKRGELCQTECFGCCGDEQLDITCKTVRENFEKELLKHYQPKLPEDSVVITREELEIIKSERFNDGKITAKGYFEHYVLNQELAKARKETAREFAEKLNTLIGNNENFNRGVFGWGTEEIKILINELEKQYGVEVE